MTDASSNRVQNCGACNPDRSIPCTCTYVADGGRFVEDAEGRLHAYRDSDAIPNRATVCERCGSGLLDGKHIASYPPCNGEDAIPNRARCERCGAYLEQQPGEDVPCRCHATRNRIAVTEAVARELHKRFIGKPYQPWSCWNDAEAVLRVIEETERA